MEDDTSKSEGLTENGEPILNQVLRDPKMILLNITTILYGMGAMMCLTFLGPFYTENDIGLARKTIYNEGIKEIQKHTCNQVLRR